MSAISILEAEMGFCARRVAYYRGVVDEALKRDSVVPYNTAKIEFGYWRLRVVRIERHLRKLASKGGKE